MVEFSIQDQTVDLDSGTGSEGDFGLWFRVQLNSDESGEEDTVIIDNIMLLGQKGDSP
ncbi:MAG: hypothetical protein KC994_19245 [Candidatus Omnitrophica bacterium]|nr:hypothetical protein [Candidatus Omnitrophota bacterium]